MKITATIITLNEEENIADCITSARAVCDEVIVVDSLSTDRTTTIAAQEGATVISQAYLGDGPQKSFAVNKAENDWILSLDADERLEADAINAIQKVSLEDGNRMYALRRRNFVGSKWIRAAGFYPDYVIRLYNRQHAGYETKKAHARVVGGRTINLNGHIRHNTYTSYEHWIARINQLSTRDAWAKHANGQRCGPAGAAMRAYFALFRKLILKRGVFQGADGWLVATTSMFHVYMKYMKLSELSRKDQNE